MNPSRHHGTTIVEILVVVAALVALLATFTPIAGGLSCDNQVQQSLDNLRRIGTAHDQYAGDWNGRQFTLVADDLGAFSGSCFFYAEANGCHPPLLLGHGCDGAPEGYFFGCGQGQCDSAFQLVKPMVFAPNAFDGAFRLVNAAGFNAYVNGRFYDPTFYASGDTIPYGNASPFFGKPCLDLEASGLVYSSYANSPAAMFDPEVMGAGTFQYKNPNGYADGYKSPPASAAAYPELKTRTIEHQWLYSNPSTTNPNFAGSVPWFFNHGIESRPATLFFDGSVRRLSVLEAMQADKRLSAQGGGSLWNRTTPLGSNGYYGAQAWDWVADTSFHVLTTKGILGRDTMSPAFAIPSDP